MKWFTNWLAGLSITQFRLLALTVFIAVAAGGGFATIALLQRFGWRAVPVMVFVLVLTVLGITACLDRLNE